jgi:hypothetical protein
MFRSYVSNYQVKGKGGRKLAKYNYTIIDSEFEYTGIAKGFPTGVIDVYESRGLPVAENLARAFIYVAQRYRIEILNRYRKVDKRYKKYEQETEAFLQKYLTLL